THDGAGGTDLIGDLGEGVSLLLLATGKGCPCVRGRGRGGGTGPAAARGGGRGFTALAPRRTLPQLLQQSGDVGDGLAFLELGQAHHVELRALVAEADGAARLQVAADRVGVFLHGDVDRVGPIGLGRRRGGTGGR